jgi:hypothetical protein
VKSPVAWKSYNRPLSVVRWVSPIVVEAAQFDGLPPAMLCAKIIAGPGGDAAGAVGPKLKLFVSAVKPCATQIGRPARPAEVYPGQRHHRRAGVETGLTADPDHAAAVAVAVAEQVELGDLPPRSGIDRIVTGPRIGGATDGQGMLSPPAAAVPVNVTWPRLVAGTAGVPTAPLELLFMTQ